MDDLLTGMLVRHTSLGLGKVVAVEPNAVHVFFPESEKRFAAKLRLPGAKALLTTEAVAPDAWLAGLTSFALDATSGRYALAANWLTHEQAVAEFLAIYPQGFADPAYAGNGKRERATRWRAASAAWREAFGNGEGERLVEEGDIDVLVRRIAAIEPLATLFAGALEEDGIADAFEDPAASRLFFDALFGLLSVPTPSRARFDKLFAAAAGLGVSPSSSWALATAFPFVAQPERHVVLWPKSTRAAAERLGCDLRYDPSPTWKTYAALRAFSVQILDRLKELGAQDFVDVDAFLHVIATRRPQGAQGADRPAARSRRTK
jgi:hypothetical protein